MKTYRQGDVVLIEINTIPQNAKKVNKPLALGEKSGHGHIITGDAEVLEFENELFVDTFNGSAKLEHLLVESRNWTKEHFEVQLPKNKKFKVVLQRAYDPFLETIIRNAD